MEAVLEETLKSYVVQPMLTCRPRTGRGRAGANAAQTPKAQPAPTPKPKAKSEKAKARREKKKAANVGKKDEELNKGLSAPKKKIQQGKRGGDAPAQQGNKKLRKSAPMPQKLIGYEAMDSNGEPFCFGFADGSCTAVKPGQECNNG